MTGSRPGVLVPRGLLMRMGYLLNRPALRFRQLAEAVLKPLSLIPPHVGVLTVLQSEGPQTQQALGKLLRIDPNTMVLLIDDLEKKKVVRRDDHPKDRRAHLIKVSPAGEGLFRHAVKQLDRLEDDFLAPLSKREQEDLRQLLLKLFQGALMKGELPNYFKK